MIKVNSNSFQLLVDRVKKVLQRATISLLFVIIVAIIINVLIIIIIITIMLVYNYYHYYYYCLLKLLLLLQLLLFLFSFLLLHDDYTLLGTTRLTETTDSTLKSLTRKPRVAREDAKWSKLKTRGKIG